MFGGDSMQEPKKKDNLLGGSGGSDSNVAVADKPGVFPAIDDARATTPVAITAPATLATTETMQKEKTTEQRQAEIIQSGT